MPALIRRQELGGGIRNVDKLHANSILIIASYRFVSPSQADAHECVRYRMLE